MPLSTRRAVVTAFAASLCAAAAHVPLLAQGKVFKLGILDGGRRPRDIHRRYDFLPLLAKLGFVDGKNLQVVLKTAELEYDELDRLARELVEERPDVILAMGPSSIAAAAGATKTVPIVMMHAGDPVGLGLVRDLSRPGGNITGNGWEQDVRQVAKTVDLLRQVAPKAKRIGVVWHIQNKSHPLYEQRFRRAITDAGLEMVSFGLRRGPEAEKTLAELDGAPLEALIVVGDYITFLHEKRIDAIIRRRMWPALVMPRVPGLYSSAVLFYGPRISEYSERGAEYIARIFNGARPGDLPIVLPSRWELFVNVRAAGAMDITVPQALRLAAEEVIE